MKHAVAFHSLIVISCLLLYSCNNPLKNKIKEWECNNHFEVLYIYNISEFDTIRGSDSSAYYTYLYDSIFNERITKLNKQISELEQEYNKKYNELQTIDNPMMAVPFERGVYSLNQKLKRANENIATYKNSPEQTELGTINERIYYYKNIADSTLGYLFACKLKGREGLLEPTDYNNEYFLNTQGKVTGRTISKTTLP